LIRFLKTFIAKATASILDKAKVKWGTLEDEEICCGLPVYDIGCEDAFAASGQREYCQNKCLEC
jgi:Fe-S oxidoreductase